MLRVWEAAARDTEKRTTIQHLVEQTQQEIKCRFIVVVRSGENAIKHLIIMELSRFLSTKLRQLVFVKKIMFR